MKPWPFLFILWGTSRYHGSKISGWQQKGVSAMATANCKQNNRFRLAKKNQLCRWSRFSLPYGVGEHNTKSFFFFFLNLDTVLSDLTQKISPTCDKLNKIE